MDAGAHGAQPDKRGEATGAARPKHRVEQFPHTRASRVIDRALLRLGDAASWLWLALLALIGASVLLRYVFGQGRIELEELQWHGYAVGFLLAIPAAVASDDHVRVDVLHERMPLRWCAWVELYGIALLLLPFVALVLTYALPFVARSYAVAEVSQAPGGLPLRWLIKAALPAGFMLLGVAAVARATRASSCLFAWPAPLPSDATDNDEGRRGGAH